MPGSKSKDLTDPVAILAYTTETTPSEPPASETIYCANCDNEAFSRTENGTPICLTCRTAYEWGGGEPKEL